MTQEDGFIEVSVNLYNKTPLVKRIIPVRIKKLKLLFDTYSMMVIGRESGLDFADVENLDPEEYLTWMVYAGYKSHKSLRNHRARISITDAVEWVNGMMTREREKIVDTWKKSREIGELMLSYQAARNKDDGEEGETKKVVGSVPES